jgi:hypothetical protein
MDFSQEEKEQLVKVCAELGAKPKFDTKEDFVSWMKTYIASQDVDSKEVKPEAVASDGIFKKELLPRVPIFSGNVSKSDHVPFEVWYFEIQCLVKQKHYSPNAILNAAHLSLRGEASRVAVRLGTEITIEQLMTKMKHLYGNVDTGEELLAKFYSASQTSEESVVQWSCRLEDLMDSVIQAGHFTRDSSAETLRSKFWSGLKHPLRELSSHKFDNIKNYEDLFVEVRKIESSLPSEIKPAVKQKSANVHSQQATENQDYGTMFNQIQAQMSEMSAKLAALSTASPPPRKPRCWRCGKIGHLQTSCRNTDLPLNGYRPVRRGNIWSQTPKPQQN